MKPSDSSANKKSVTLAASPGKVLITDQEGHTISLGISDTLAVLKHLRRFVALAVTLALDQATKGGKGHD